FFSRRRRHTSSKRDWSSDVCSSDLRFVPATLPRSRGEREDRRPSPTTPTTSDRLESSRSPWVVEFVRDTVLSSVSGADEGLVEKIGRAPRRARRARRESAESAKGQR